MKTIKNRKKTLDSKSLLALIAAAGILLTGCAEKKKDVMDNGDTITPTTSDSSSSEVDNNVEEPTYDDNASLFTSIAKADFYTFADSFDAVSRQYFSKSMNRENVDTALLILNMQYLKENDIAVLDQYFADSKGVNTADEMNQLYKFMGILRDYNIKADKDSYLKVSNLLLSVDEINVNLPYLSVNFLDDYCLYFIEYNKKLAEGTNTPKDDETAIRFFNEVKGFANGTSTINGFSQTELPRDSIIATEIIMQQISVICKDYIPAQDIEELTKALNGHNYLYSVEQDIAEFNGRARVTTDDSQISEIEVNINKYWAVANEELIDTGVLEFDEYKSLFTVANIDYFMKDENNKAVLNKIYPEGFNLDNIFTSAECAVEKIELHNASTNDFYDFGHLYIDSVVDIMNTKYVATLSKNIYLGEFDSLKSSANKLKKYNQYSGEIADSYKYQSETYTMNKNAISRGATQVIDWISYYTYINNSSKFETSYKESMLALIDGTTTGMSAYDDIVIMVTGFCADKNENSFTYKMGK